MRTDRQGSTDGGDDPRLIPGFVSVSSKGPCCPAVSLLIHHHHDKTDVEQIGCSA